MSGKLYVCGTPIGNLEDITYRTLRVLNEVDLIAAEDTRHSIKLLNHFEISKPLTSYHEYNKDNKGGYLINKFSISVEIILQSVLFCKNSFPPIWSAFECVLIIYFRLKLFSFKILFIFLPASLSFPLSIKQISDSFNLYIPIFMGLSI